MNLRMILGPIIGAVIGYCTNYIAVKMLFWPRKAIKIGNFTLPFTPGVIPKGKDRLAVAIGNAVGENLLTGDDIKEKLLSDELRKNLEDCIINKIRTSTEEGQPIKELIEKVITEEKYSSSKDMLQSAIKKEVLEGIQSLNVGEKISVEGTKMIKQKVSGSFIGMMVNDNLIASFAEPIKDGVNSYIEEHGDEIISPIIDSKIGDLEELTIGETLNSLNIFEKDVRELTSKIYLSFVEKGMKSLSTNINIAKIVEDKVKAMDVKEIEDLTLSVMKKELDTVVNLGAVIGFVIGILNIFA